MLGVYQPDIHVQYGSAAALRLMPDSDLESVMSSNASLYGTSHQNLRYTLL